MEYKTMPYPSEYQRATDHFAKFLADAKIESELCSVHQAYTMIQGVFRVFRRRLNLRDSIIFTSALNAGLRALYIADWDPDEDKHPFGSLEAMNREVRPLRPGHNFAPDDAILCVARRTSILRNSRPCWSGSPPMRGISGEYGRPGPVGMTIDCILPPEA
jgi:uncharacterized protein (DUF2267 family)